MIIERDNFEHRLVIRSTADISLSLLEKTITERNWATTTKIDEQQFFFKSMEPPSFLHFIGTLPWWGQLGASAGTAVAAGYLGQAGKALWNKQPQIAEHISDRLWSLVEMVLNIQSLVLANTKIEIGFPSGNEPFPAVLVVPNVDIETVAFQIAALCYHSTAMEKFVDGPEFSPSLGATMNVLDDGSIILNWYDRENLDSRTQTFLVGP